MKAKTNKSAQKRITNISGTGKIMRRNISGQHLAAGKSKRTLRGSNKKSEISRADNKKIRKLILK